MTKEYKIYDTATLAFQKLNPQDGDIIIINFPYDIHPEQMKLFAEQLKPQIPENVTILCTREGVTVNSFSEEEMNKLGWYKIDKEKLN